MGMPCLGRFRRTVGTLFVLLLGCASLASASATLLLEEPYGKLGFFTATGHAAVYLSGVCAETPLVLRPCAPGETGIVISRYNGVEGYDWIAIPLIPYLYALDRAEDIPLYADPKMVSFLRERYRREYLESVVPDLPNGADPDGNWYELVGTSYDRTVYGFEIETRPEQDMAFIGAYNAGPNRSHFRTVSRNCADFVKDVINFYHPKALRRSIVADVGITTPKQMAKGMVKFSARHPELKFSRFVIPQVPGSDARSTPVHGVVESFFKSKKYIVPSAIVSPIFAGCVAAVYLGTNADHFDPARQALVYNPLRPLEAPIGAEDRRAYQIELSHLLADVSSATQVSAPSVTGAARTEKLGRLLRNADPDLDEEGRPVLRIGTGEGRMTIGASAGNIFASESPDLFTQHLLESRLREELRRGSPPKASESDVERDWQMLLRARNVSEEPVTDARPAKLVQASSASRVERGGNRP
jgi:hypothetical protein